MKMSSKQIIDKGVKRGDMPNVFLVRHAESQSNVGLPTSNPQLVKLTDGGWNQAKAVARFLKEAQFYPDLIVTSPYLRTKQTAALTTLAFPYALEEEWPVQEFTYLSSWHDEPSTKKERRPKVEAYWDISDPTYVDGPGSESFDEFIARVRDAMERVERQIYETIVIFSHEQFICAYLWLLRKDLPGGKPDQEAMKEFRCFLLSHPVPNGRLVPVEYYKTVFK